MSKQGFTHIPLGPWPRGMVRPQRQSDVAQDALWDAVNVDVRPEGSVATRWGWDKVLDANAHSLYEAVDGTVYGVVNGSVVVFDANGVSDIQAVSGSVSWTSVAGLPHFATADGVFAVHNTSAEQLVATRDDFDDVRELVNMPGGEWLVYWNGRLVVARGGSLLFSEPLRYGAHDPLTGYLSLGQPVEWMAALETGIYVGHKNQVIWLEGRQPTDLSLKVVAGRSAPGMATVIPYDPAPVVVFFTHKGFTLGDAAGSVHYPQAANFSDIPLYPGKLVYHDSRLFALRAD